MTLEIQYYRDLRVWQKGIDIAQSCYLITKEFPQEELYGMTSQIRRASAEFSANIAEGYGREYRANYIQFLRIAQGSLKELETHLILSERVKLATSEVINPILTECESLGKMLRSLIRSLSQNQ